MDEQKTIVFFDWDRTLATFPHEAGVEAAYQYLKIRTTERAARLLATSLDSLWKNSHHAARTGEPNSLLETLQDLYIAKVKTDTPSAPGLLWSRELWLSMGVRMHLLQPLRIPKRALLEATDAYWKALGEKAVLYPYALWCTGLLKHRGCTIAIATLSDSRLTYEKPNFYYDPAHAGAKKEERVRAQRLLTHDIDHVISGDPIGKPHKEYWQRALTTAGTSPGDRLFMIGDDYTTDIIGASDMNMVTILVDRAGRYKDRCSAPRANIIVKSLEQVPQYVLKGGFP